ncbi:hypothetical protein [Nocardioides daejeonensis]|uniref:hypothetical protein n=1 Tax=Nocardioides daejeonensis TaxID=1046556 RepID=UPI000D748C65|nr:hypothetical protein [Nocardioides daejeonensis]
MNLLKGLGFVLPLCLATVVLVILAGLGVIDWVVPISVAIALAVLAVFVGWWTRGHDDSTTHSTSDERPV